MKTLWVKKHAPADFSEYCFQNTALRGVILSLLESEDIPHLLLVGDPGTGKSTLAHLLIEFNKIDPMDVLTIDATLENNVDVVREKIWTFVTTASFGDTPKVVLLEEFDRMSATAQDVFREMMVRYSDFARFILTGNHQHKIAEAIQSRCQTIVFDSMSAATAYKRMVAILNREDVTYTEADLKRLISDNLPDLRKIINTAQLWCTPHDGKLKLTYQQSGNLDLDKELSAMLARGGFDQLQTWILTHGTPTDLSQSFYKTMFYGLQDCKLFTSNVTYLDRAIVAIGKYQYQHSTSADPVICAMALISEFRLITQGF